MVNNNITGLLFIIIFMSFLTHKTYSYEYDEQETVNDIALESHMIKPSPFLMDQYAPTDKLVDIESSVFPSHRRSESAEKYFDWVKKTQRPVEYLRGKRFWLFAKKEDNDMHTDLIPNTKTQQNSLTQGLWRSGIVGRRR